MVDITVWGVGRVVLRVTFWSAVGWAYDHGCASRCGYVGV